MRSGLYAMRDRHTPDVPQSGGGSRTNIHILYGLDLFSGVCALFHICFPPLLSPAYASVNSIQTCTVFSDGGTVLLLIPGTGNMQARRGAAAQYQQTVTAVD